MNEKAWLTMKAMIGRIRWRFVADRNADYDAWL